MSVFDLFFPKRCLGCGKIGRYFCDVCRRTIHSVLLNEAICPVCEKPAIDGATHPRCRTRYSPDGLTSFFHYDGMIRKAVKTLKYRLVSDLTAEFISLISTSTLSQCTMHHSPFNALAPIPLHRMRLMERGFNQAEVLGKVLAMRLHMPMRTDMLRRTKKTLPQVEMNKREDRLRNMAAVFSVDRNVSLRGAGIILFDDVFTTGATMRSAANVLKRHGATRVWGVTMAR